MSRKNNFRRYPKGTTHVMKVGNVTYFLKYWYQRDNHMNYDIFIWNEVNQKWYSTDFARSILTNGTVKPVF